MRHITSPEEAKIAQNNTGSGNNTNLVDFKNDYVDLKLDASGKTVRTVRLVGFPVLFGEHSAKTRSAEDPKVFVNKDFVDSNINKKFNRYCSDDSAESGSCFWCDNKYRRTNRYAWTCLERQPDGTSVPKILSKGITIFEEFFKYESDAKDINDANPQEAMVTRLGDIESHDIRITATKDDKALGGVKYSVMILASRKTKLTDEELSLLRSKGELTAEERATLINDNPAYAKAPDFYFTGFNYAKIYRYFPPRDPSRGNYAGDSSTTSAPLDNPFSQTAPVVTEDDLEIDNEHSEPEEEAPKPAPATRKRAAAAPVVQEESDVVFENAPNLFTADSDEPAVVSTIPSW